jgi:hypothetical protein
MIDIAMKPIYDSDIRIMNDIILDETGDIQLETDESTVISNIILNGLVSNFNNWFGFNWNNYYSNLEDYIGDITETTGYIENRVRFYLSNRKEVNEILDISIENSGDGISIYIYLDIVLSNYNYDKIELTFSYGV